jgi:hypothetical protein
LCWSAGTSLLAEYFVLEHPYWLNILYLEIELFGGVPVRVSGRSLWAGRNEFVAHHHTFIVKLRMSQYNIFQSVGRIPVHKYSNQ